MDSRFSTLRQRDNSVSMLRVKMARRKSQSQKENRERTVNTRRQLEKLAEMEMSSLDASMAMANMSTIQEKTQNNARPAKSLAQQERVKQLERWKERKALVREKEKRGKEHKGVFKTGLYQPKDIQVAASRPVVPPASATLKEKKVNTAVSQSTRVTRSMKQQQEVQKDLNIGAHKGKPLMERSNRTLIAPVKPAPSATKVKVSGGHPTVAGPAMRPLSTRSGNRPAVAKAPVVKDKLKEKPADVRSTRTRAVANPVVPPPGRVRNCKDKAPVSSPAMPKESELNEIHVHGPEKMSCPSNQTSCPMDENMLVDQAAKEPAPDVDTGAPDVDTGAPDVDTGAPDVDTGAPDVDTGAPDVDTGAPDVDTGAPDVDTGAPDVDTGAPDVDTGAPDVDTGAPDVDTGAPDMDTGALSFAPKGFVFQAPAGLSGFKFEPLTPRSADTFLTPSSSFNFPPVPVFTAESQVELRESSPPKSPHHTPSHTSPRLAPQTPGSPLESKHDVPYFRSEIANETDRLTALCLHWESRVEDESIPEEMRDRMRTAVGQARLLMKERFNQFSGLVDDCELGRGEKITTCTDLQGFWDMVYYQVEDVKKKFDALKAAEGRDWVDDHKPPPRQRKIIKKPSAAPVKVTGTKAAAKSRLAAVKAAMKAKQQAAEEAAKDAGNSDDNLRSQEPQPKAGSQTLETVVFDGGFFQVESPAKPLVRGSSRLSAAMLPQASPCSTHFTPRRLTRCSLSLGQAHVQACGSPAQPSHTPVQLCLTLEQTPAPKSQLGTPQPYQSRKDDVNVSLCFSLVKELSDETQSERSPTQQPESVSTQEDTTSVPKLGTPVLPSISVQECGKSAEAVGDGPPLSPRLSISLCKTPPPAPHGPEPSSGLSFMLSPCVTPSQPPISSPTVQVHVDAQQSTCGTPDGSVVEAIPGLDFERYLQPTQRCSLSPMETVASEMWSPMDTNVDMESPSGQLGELLTQQEPALSAVSSAFPLQSPQVQSAQCDMLLFTPDLKDRIRQSVCPSDLMVFTPPSSK